MVVAMYWAPVDGIFYYYLVYLWSFKLLGKRLGKGEAGIKGGFEVRNTSGKGWLKTSEKLGAPEADQEQEESL